MAGEKPHPPTIWTCNTSHSFAPSVSVRSIAVLEPGSSDLNRMNSGFICQDANPVPYVFCKNVSPGRKEYVWPKIKIRAFETFKKETLYTSATPFVFLSKPQNCFLSHLIRHWVSSKKKPVLRRYEEVSSVTVNCATGERSVGAIRSAETASRHCSSSAQKRQVVLETQVRRCKV